MGGRNRHHRGGKKTATIVVDPFDHFSTSDQIPSGETRSFVTLMAIDEIVITSFLLLFLLLFRLFYGSMVA
jgi:hypothetical protein